MLFSISRVLLGLLVFSTSSFAFAINTKDCPTELIISVGQPVIDKKYAKALYENYFRENEVVSNSLKIVTKTAGRCVYRGEEKSKIFQAELKGSLKANSVEPASIAVFGELPIISAKLPFDLSSFVVFGKIATLSPYAVTFSTGGSLYRVGQLCSYGECAIDYVYLGKFADFRVEAKP